MRLHFYFPNVRRMLLCFSPKFLNTFGQLPRSFAGPSLTLSPPETGPQILERWSYADEVHLGQISPSEGFWSRMYA